jgi:methionine synthase I (cobalamin-dependent)
LTHPEAVKQLHRDWVKNGSDVVQAVTYYANEIKCQLIGKHDSVEAMNTAALAIAKEE